MKHRWIGIPVLAATLALGACAPTQQGTDEESEATPSPEATATMDATPSPEATAEATEEAAGTSEPTPADYDYDY